jgi:hypothetical protein
VPGLVEDLLQPGQRRDGVEVAHSGVAATSPVHSDGGFAYADMKPGVLFPNEVLEL